ncbi:MAG: hypothetical protein UW34_C0008G0011 [Parcubacteria group bacterium GW2011_GWA2_44_15]|nr:MAG: hypothetical protein UW34_C0008G0011 [Parcubacteria group bacterium GW2011_GWA2_44_15]
MNEYARKSVDELKKLLVEKRDALRVFRSEMTGGKTKNVKNGRAVRAAIARILTEINIQKSK